jgi:hypothetical protein
MRISLWNSGIKGADYRFITRAISEFFGISGTAVLVRLYLGPYLDSSTDLNSDGIAVNTDGLQSNLFDPADSSVLTGGITAIQDPVLLENRDRHYDPNPIEMRMVYNINDLEFNLQQFGLFLANDTLFIECHLTDMIAQCGRKIIPGDVLELPHRRDTGLDPANQLAVNKFYVVDDASRAADGYSVTWYPHIWRMKLSPMPASQEFNDILNMPITDAVGLPSSVNTVASSMTTAIDDLGINEAVDAQAKIDVAARYLETQQFYLVTPEADSQDYPWVFTGDGIPPNGAALIGTGIGGFPSTPNVGDYYLRTDYSPNTLFQYNGIAWQIQEINNRPNWTLGHRILMEFVNNSTITANRDGTTIPEKINLSQLVRIKSDF